MEESNAGDIEIGVLKTEGFASECGFGLTALRKWGGAHQTSNHLPKPHI